ncbi:UDP-2,3-diacylglucosamine diphosphatase [Candidatus Sodalis endolongispinus]|uniref:UDP-2,3-diacylglucosamine hydrolase n=1 Tax=Candidatus Sodalis endolongispinus TaxID=2812662 RepID=A0ABS5YC72_9GAMM|nr:UDP-2,3-diacylglucosamine diphosphatase [Candidatus Sodalis endolongispinus]MBT9432558.1 UDP-2,3-diacylglucosamine diphosphatase [Candidatus Sodalis endolongispinus]
MSTLFVADIHLCAQEPAITAGFLHFLRTRAIAAQALYILGDLFEVWIGDDDPNPLHHEIAMALQALTRRGIPCYFIHGNRDFLLGKRYAAACGMTLLPAQRVMQLDGLRVVILHGDTLCTDDNDYQRFRRRVHQRWLQRLFLSLPLRLRLRIADRMRANSQRANADKTADIMDVNAQTVMAVMEDTGATVMIHGHTHRPAIHQLPGERRRSVLGAWHHQGSAIEVSTSGVMLHEFAFGG